MSDTKEASKHYLVSDEKLDPECGAALPPKNTTDPAVSADASADEPTDRYGFVYLVFLLGGFATLLPWNVFITAFDYFLSRFKGQSYENSFMNWIVLISMLGKLGTAASALKLNGKYTFKKQVVASLLVNIATFTVFTATALNESGNADLYFAMVLVFSFFGCGITTAFLQNSLLATSARFPPIYMGAVFSGMGMAGVGVNVSSLITGWTAKVHGHVPTQEQVNLGAFYYFLVATIAAVIALGAYLSMLKTPFYIHHATLRGDAPASGTEASGLSWRRFVSISRRLTPYVFAVVFTYAVTLAAFPSMTATVQPLLPPDSRSLVPTDLPDPQASGYVILFASIHFLIFNVGDWIGKILAGFPIGTYVLACLPKHPSAAKILGKGRGLALLAVARLLFVVLFFLCNSRGGLAVFSDVLYFIVLLLFAITSGWVSSIAMMDATKHVPSDECSMAGSVMSLYLMGGLTVGATLGFVVKAIQDAALN